MVTSVTLRVFVEGRVVNRSSLSLEERYKGLKPFLVADTETILHKGEDLDPSSNLEALAVEVQSPFSAGVMIVRLGVRVKDNNTDYYYTEKREEVIEYMKQDIILLEGVMQKAQKLCWDVYKVEIEKWMTVASLALGIYQINGMDLDSMCGFIEAYVEYADSMGRPFLPYRGKYNILLFPTGQWVGVYYSEELKYAREQGYNVLTIRGYLFQKMESPF
ncbi:DNA polymerase [Bienertia sinuspersici]